MDKLYHVDFLNNPVFQYLKPFIPNPQDSVFLEEPTIPRVCLAPSLELCLTALGFWNLLENKGIDYEYESISATRSAVHLTSPFIVKLYEFESTSLNDKYFMNNEEILRNKYVFDAHLTKECWYLDELPVQNIYEVEVLSFINRCFGYKALYIDYSSEKKEEIIEDSYFNRIEKVDYKIKTILPATKSKLLKAN